MGPDAGGQLRSAFVIAWPGFLLGLGQLPGWRLWVSVSPGIAESVTLLPASCWALEFPGAARDLSLVSALLHTGLLISTATQEEEEELNVI